LKKDDKYSPVKVVDDIAALLKLVKKIDSH